MGVPCTHTAWSPDGGVWHSVFSTAHCFGACILCLPFSLLPGTFHSLIYLPLHTCHTPLCYCTHCLSHYSLMCMEFPHTHTLPTPATSSRITSFLVVGWNIQLYCLPIVASTMPRTTWWWNVLDIFDSTPAYTALLHNQCFFTLLAPENMQLHATLHTCSHALCAPSLHHLLLP